MTTTVTRGELRNLIDGKLVEASDGGTFENVNPATEAVLGVVADATARDMDAAIAAARRAADESAWATDPELRKRCLSQLQEALESEREEFRHELVAEVGCPVQLTYATQLDVPLADSLSWPREFIDRFEWERDLPDNHVFGIDSTRRVWKEAVGVVGAIVPWNFPLEVTLGKLGQALATGNTVVLKAAPDTPWNATRLGRLAAEKTELPAGVLNVVTSADHAIGEQLVLDPRVDMISFTGSTATGRRIMEKAAPTLKRLFLELGGKSASIVLDDADFEAALPSVAGGVCVNAGQGCVIATRLLLPRSRYEEGVSIVAATMAAMTVGDPTDMGTNVGPLIRSGQRDRVESYLLRGVEEGADLVVGGGRPEHLTRGWFVQPTLFANVDPTMTVAQEEIFGPVLSVLAYDDDDDAVRIANSSQYGLGAEVSSGSVDRALSVGRRLRAGNLTINGGVWYGPDAPFGGYKASGIGRQNGVEGFEQHLQTKAVGIRA